MSADDFDLSRVLASKRAFRRHLAARPLAEKLHLLDELRARALAIRRAAQSKHRSEGGRVSENHVSYGTKRPL